MSQRKSTALPERAMPAFDFRSKAEWIARHADKNLRVVTFLAIQVIDFIMVEFHE